MGSSPTSCLGFTVLRLGVQGTSVLRYWWVFLFVCVFVFLCYCLVLLWFSSWERLCVCQPFVSDCRLGLMLGQNLSVIVKKNNLERVPGRTQPQGRTKNFCTGRGEAPHEKLWPRGEHRCGGFPGMPAPPPPPPPRISLPAGQARKERGARPTGPPYWPHLAS